jgi:hypothetical protein
VQVALCVLQGHMIRLRNYRMIITPPYVRGPYMYNEYHTCMVPLSAVQCRSSSLPSGIELLCGKFACGGAPHEHGWW